MTQVMTRKNATSRPSALNATASQRHHLGRRLVPILVVSIVSRLVDAVPGGENGEREK